MNALVRRFLYEDANFEEVLILLESDAKKWSEIERIIPEMPKGWFELSRVPSEDRIEFVRAYWQGRLPFQPKAHAAINRFFASLDDVGVVLTKEKGKWTAQLIYSLMDHSSFFRGLPPVSEKDLADFRNELNVPFPNDWTSFVRIHNGFGKLSEIELLPVQEIPESKRRLMESFARHGKTVKSGQTIVDPSSLFPFYEVTELSSFQCFYADWYPGNEMGNVYFSGMDESLSDITRIEEWGENGAFLTFLDWLVSYLEGMEVAP
ncbi:MAG: SMI1/KNR4 family protein [Chlamydiae bacterium]|nr:SMI1/KNR4 family protein [Chlamydiota bacterium]